MYIELSFSFTFCLSEAVLFHCKVFNFKLLRNSEANAFALFAVSVVVNSQAATAKILLPVAVAIGLPGPGLIGVVVACVVALGLAQILIA